MWVSEPGVGGVHVTYLVLCILVVRVPFISVALPSIRSIKEVDGFVDVIFSACPCGYGHWNHCDGWGAGAKSLG